LAFLHRSSRSCITRESGRRDEFFGNTGILSPTPTNALPSVSHRIGIMTMPVSKRPSLVSSSFQLPSFGENTLIAILLAVFLTLHILADAILQDATPVGAAPMQEESRASSYD
jgi:hypothetical protein